jgi:hypothetical protein
MVDGRGLLRRIYGAMRGDLARDRGAGDNPPCAAA